MTKPKKTKTAPAPDLRDPTPAEIKAGQEAAEQQAARPGRATVNWLVSGDAVFVENPHTDARAWHDSLMEAFATSSGDFANDTLLKLNSVLGQIGGGTGSARLNAALALIGGLAPTDEGQTAIAVQIAATHAASMNMTARAVQNANSGYLEAASSYTNMATKLSRTMAAHIEALTKLRGGGRQVIEHRYYQVNAENALVGDNSQAIFQAPAEGGKNANPRQPREALALAHEPGAEMPCPQPAGEAVPVAGHAREEAMSTSRGEEPRRAHGAGER